MAGPMCHPSKNSISTVLNRLLKLEWDEQLPEHIAMQWKTIRDEFIKFEQLEIPRWIHTPNQNIQLHGFSDASEAAYSAVVYCRSKDENDQVFVNIIAAKTKVAPLKQISLPKLELCGALLLTKLIKIIQNAFQFNNMETYGWTDSTIVLAWLSSHPSKWKTYVANRTSEILETLPRCHWNHVRSKDNPADCASRGIPPSSLCQFNLWWEGPAWLKTNTWPIKNNAYQTILDEKKSQVVASNVQFQTNTEWPDEIFQKFSSFSKLIRVFSFCFRFITNCRSKIKTVGHLKVTELKIGTDA